MSTSILSPGKTNQILYPDGTWGPMPEDGAFFIDKNNLGASYQWDGILCSWVDHKGDLFNPLEKLQKTEAIEPKKEKKCGCGAHAVGVDMHAHYCDLYKEDQ